MVSSVREFWKLTRFEHAVMLAFAVFIAETIALGALPSFTLVIALSLLVPVFSEMGSFALNDYMDMETDRLNKKNDRPLVKGTIKPETALAFAIISLAISTVLAYFVGVLGFIIALAFNLVAILYNWKLKDLPLAGNVYIALTMAIPFVFGSFVVSPVLSPVVVALALLGFVAGLAREIVKSVQDMEGDAKARGSKTLPVVIGRKMALAVSIGLYLSFIPLTAVPFAMGLEPAPLPLAFVGAADALILGICYIIIRSPGRSFGFARNASLAAFMLGMMGIFLAVL
ncbi:UbiA family prenyltransferase [Candidatus Micrarchaeota archaeon]|nr:UbiA family prenyltransferase [Candidatus Micrarchaeota archaeon]